MGRSVDLPDGSPIEPVAPPIYFFSVCHVMCERGDAPLRGFCVQLVGSAASRLEVVGSLHVVRRRRDRLLSRCMMVWIDVGSIRDCYISLHKWAMDRDGEEVLCDSCYETSLGQLAEETASR